MLSTGSPLQPEEPRASGNPAPQAQAAPRGTRRDYLYVLASTDRQVRWFSFDPSDPRAGFELVPELDLDKVPLLHKDDARRAARLLRLREWRYVRIG